LYSPATASQFDADSLFASKGSRRNVMLKQILVGIAASAPNITIHALIMVTLVHVARRVATIYASRPSLLTAMNGVLLIGWSTAVIFEIMRRTMHRDFDVLTAE